MTQELKQDERDELIRTYDQLTKARELLQRANDGPYLVRGSASAALEQIVILQNNLVSVLIHGELPTQPPIVIRRNFIGQKE